MHKLALFILTFIVFAACAAPPDHALGPVVADGIQLKINGRALDMRGVNYIHPTTADLTVCASLNFGGDAQCPWQLAPVAADFDQLQARGVNTIRVFLNYYVFGGAKANDPAYSMAYALTNFDQLLAAANQRGIYVMPVLLAKYPQDRFRPEDYASALDLHVRPVVEHFKQRPGIIMWDLFNEIDLAGPIDERCWDYDNRNYAGCFPLAQERLHFIKAMHDEVKRLDPERLVTTSVGFAKSYFRPVEADMRLADIVDLYSLHYYDNDPYNSGRYAAHWYYGQGFPTDLGRAVDDLYALKLNKPVLVTEIGFPSSPGSKRSEAEMLRDLRTARDLLRARSAEGMLLWPFQNDLDQIPGDLFTKR